MGEREANCFQEKEGNGLKCQILLLPFAAATILFALLRDC